MIPISAHTIAANLTPVQRGIVLDGPTSFAQADAIPEGLFEGDLVWDRDTGDESYFWTVTELGLQVRRLIEEQEQDR